MEPKLKVFTSDHVTRLQKKAELASQVEELARRGNAQVLRDYWAFGPGADKINWQEEEGNLTRCHDLIVKYMPEEDDAWGYCERRHEQVFGESNAARDARLKEEGEE